MARGRMLNRELGGSRKFALLPERAALLYVLAYAYSDREGRLEADDEALLEYASRYGRRRGYTDEIVEADRDAIARAGLWLVWRGERGEVFAQIVDFHKHNRTDPKDEPASAIPEPEGYSDDAERKRWGRPPYTRKGRKEAAEAAPARKPRRTPGPPRGNPRATPGPPQGNPGREVEVEVEVKGEVEVERAPAPPAEAAAAAATVVTNEHGDPVRPWTPAERAAASARVSDANRLLAVWKALHEKLNEESERPIVAPRAHLTDAERVAASVADVLPYFPDDEALEAEVRRVARCYTEKGLVVTFRGVCGQIGQVFAGTTCPEPVTWRKETSGPRRVGVAPEVRERVPALAKVGKEIPS